MLKGYRGCIKADAFHGYDNLYGEGKATEVGCWAHARRKFDEALATDPLRANRMPAPIAQLYVIEKKAQDEHLDAEAVKALRQQFSKPILDDQIRPLLESWGPAGRRLLQPDRQLQALRDRPVPVPAGCPRADQHPSGQPDR